MSDLRGSNLPLQALNELRQVGIVCRNLESSIHEMLMTGVGPWHTYTFDRHTVADRMYRGKSGNFEFKVALADMPGLHWELIQPLGGDSIFSDFLSERGEGVHHLLYDRKGMSLAEKEASFAGAGFECIMSGRWLGEVLFAYYERDPASGLIIEILDRKPDFRRPEPEEVYA